MNLAERRTKARRSLSDRRRIMSATNRIRHGALKDCPLTPCELRAIRGIAAGLPYKQIAIENFVTDQTIRSQLHTAYQRLGVIDRAQAVLVCSRNGWLDPEPPPVLEQDRVTPVQKLYNESFLRWLKGHDPDDRVEMDVLQRIIERQRADGVNWDSNPTPKDQHDQLHA